MPALTVNARPVEFRLDPQTPLLWALRDAANLTGTKYGCGVGDCGACMVLVDGEATKSCLISLGEAEGRVVVTIEGLSHDRSHPVQQALVAEQAIQCGFCTPGIAIAMAALLARNADPSVDDIKAAITNLCPCGVYPRLVRAVRVTEPLRVDGQLDEAIYTEVHPFGGFLQTVPREGEPATEKTEAWILFDNDTLRDLFHAAGVERVSIDHVLNHIIALAVLESP